MNLWQFLVSQGLLFFLFFVSAILTNGGQGLVANIIMNLMTFLTASWLLARSWRNILDPPTIWVFVLATTLSFNGVTYLIGYAAYIPMPDFLHILQDFALVTALSVLGILLGLKTSRPEPYS